MRTAQSLKQISQPQRWHRLTQNPGQKGTNPETVTQNHREIEMGVSTTKPLLDPMLLIHRVAGVSCSGGSKVLTVNTIHRDSRGGDAIKALILSWACSGADSAAGREGLIAPGLRRGGGASGRVTARCGDPRLTARGGLKGRGHTGARPRAAQPGAAMRGLTPRRALAGRGRGVSAAREKCWGRKRQAVCALRASASFRPALPEARRLPGLGSQPRFGGSGEGSGRVRRMVPAEAQRGRTRESLGRPGSDGARADEGSGSFGAARREERASWQTWVKGWGAWVTTPRQDSAPHTPFLPTPFQANLKLELNF